MIMKKWLHLSRQINHLNKAIAVLARWSLLLMIGLGFWNVIGRYLGTAIGQNLSSNSFIEGQWYLFDLAFLLGLGWTLQRQGHVRVDIIQSRLKATTKAKLDLLGSLFLLLPFAIGVLIISIDPTFQSWKILEASPDPNGLPRYLVKSLIPLGFFLLALQGISEAIQSYSMLKKSNSKPN